MSLIRLKLPTLSMLALLSLVLLSVSACSFSLAEDIVPPPGSEQLPAARTQVVPVSGPLYPLVPPNPENGRSIYAEKCAPCHGSSGQGDGARASQLPNPVSPLGSAEFALLAAPARWYTQVTEGNLERFMPPFASLTDQQRWDVVAYALSLSAPAATVDQGVELYQQNCANCHGELGRGDGPDAPGLSAKLPNLADQEYMAQKSAADFIQAIRNGIAPGMPAFGDQFSEEEAWALAAYLRTLSYAGGAGPEAADAPDQSPVTTTLAIAGGGELLGTVQGNIINGSGGEIPSGLEVVLRGFDNMTPVITVTTGLQPEGSYVFENVEMPEGRVFLVTVNYGQTTYGSEIGMMESGLSTLDLPVEIYETTTDASVLKTDRLHMFFEFVDEQTLRVIELYILSNPSDATLVPPAQGQASVTFALPQGAANLEFQDGALGGRYIKTEDGFGDTASIRPGSSSYELVFAFEMPYDRKLDLVQPLKLPVDAVVILIPEDGVKIKSDMLIDEGIRDVQGTQYRLYNGSGIAAGTDLRLTISGRPSSGNPNLAAGSSNSMIIGLGSFGLALLLAGVWLYRRTQANGDVDAGELQEQEAVAAAAAAGGDSPETLMDAIIALDDLYQEGKLSEEAYLQRREQLKARLKDVMGGPSAAVK